MQRTAEPYFVCHEGSLLVVGDSKHKQIHFKTESYHTFEKSSGVVMQCVSVKSHEPLHHV